MKNVFQLIIYFALFILIAITAVMLYSCFDGGDDMGIFTDSDEKIADQTFNEIIIAIGLKDDSKIVDMFSNSIKKDESLLQSASKFIDYIHGDIISFSLASDAGVGVDYKIENGKKRKEIQSAFCINTTEDTYFVAIKECTKDQFNANNIGIVSIYVIESDNWTEDYTYRGDGRWISGIHIASIGSNP